MILLSDWHVLPEIEMFMALLSGPTPRNGLLTLIATIAIVGTACPDAFLEPAFGAIVSTPDLTVTAGNPVTVPIMIDEANDIAGVKIVVSYDADLLEFKTAGKTEYSNSMLHVVNDQTPGILIIVMAGAQGIRGKSLAFLELSFLVQNEVPRATTTNLKISGIELVTEGLEKVEATVKTSPITILPRKQDGKQGLDTK